jgi:hypothetical protein
MEGKVIPVQAVEAFSCEKLRLPYFQAIGSQMAARLSYAPAAFYPQEDSWYSFLLEAESTPRS